MKKRQIKHPRKVVWVMRDFINEIHGLTYTAMYLPPKTKENETAEDVFERLSNMEEVEEPMSVEMIYRKRGFAVLTEAEEEEQDSGVFSFYYNLEELWCKGHFQFSKDFFSRCPMSRGFASITLTILHELGHKNSQQEFNGYDRIEAIKKIEKTVPRELINFEYFKLPDEKAATDWAIEWLQNAENRKKAKEFEKKFFACFY
jgi:hypothetical protein